MSAPPPPGRQWAWFFDFDGTLAELAPRPDAVVVDDRTRRNMAALRTVAGGAVAVVSGRSIADVDALLGGVVTAVAGQHGSERRTGEGASIRAVARPAALDVAAREFASLAVHHTGLLVEDKGLTLAVHFRLAPALEGEVAAHMDAIRPSLGPGFLVQGGKMLFEIVPVGRNKGTAVAEFMHEAPFAGRTPVFIGDDVTDEHAFMVVNAMGGHSIKVGAGDSIARYRLGDVDEVQAWLAPLVAAGSGMERP